MLDPDLIKNFPADLARNYTCLPLFRSGNELHMVIANPFDRQAADAIAANLEAMPVLSMGNEDEIKELITRFYGPSSDTDLAGIIEKLNDDKSDSKGTLLKDLFRKAEFEQITDLSISRQDRGVYNIQFQGRIKTPETK
ncbi:MAG: hypothetical protein R6V10_05970 [bacterium]